MSLPLAFLYGEFGRVGLVDMDSGLAPHVHRHSHFIFNLSGGEVIFRVDRRDAVVTADTALLVDPWRQHGWPGPAPGQGPVLFVTFYIEPVWLAGTAARGVGGVRPPVALHAPEPLISVTPDLKAMVHGLADSLLAIHRDEAAAVTLVTAICTLVARRHLAAGLTPVPVSQRPHDFRIRRALARLEDPASCGRLDEIADEVGLSRSHFFELFRRSTGFSPQFYINVSRMESAIHGLMRTDAPLAELADSLGFSTQGNFTRFFRQQLGVTPDRFRSAAVGI